MSRRAGGLFAATALCTLGLASPTTAATPPSSDSSGTSSQPTAPTAESWYAPLSPTCATPVGCLPVAPPSAYPAGTLHVGVLAGQEESRTYLAMRLPLPGTLKGGSLQLPVGPASDGTVAPDAAKVRACLVSGTVKDKVAGDVGTRPNPDCSVSSPAVAKTSSSGTVLTVDLAPFVVDWAEEPVGALALLPAEGAAPTDAWHVAFSRHDRTGAGVTPLSVTLLVDADDDAPTTSTDDPVPDPVAPEPAMPVATLPPAISPGVLPPVVNPPGSQVPSVAGSRNLVPAGQAIDTSFAYRGVFLLPLLVLLAAAWVARAFTRDLAEEQA